MPPKPIPIPIILSLVGMACGPGAHTGAELPLIEGADTVEAGSVSDAQLLPWRLADSPSFRAGGGRGGEAHQFVEVAAAMVRADGSVVIADGRSGVVRVYEPTGELRGQLGSPGEGPGEFRSPSSLLSIPGDSIGVWDQSLWRTSVFSPQGVFVRSERYDPTAPDLYPMQGMWPGEVRLGPGGTRIIRLIGKGTTKGSSAGDVPGDPDRVGYALHRPGSSKAEMIAMLPREEVVEVEAPWGPAFLTPPLAAGPKIAISPGGRRTCVGHQATPELLCVDRAGGQVGLRWLGERKAVEPEDPAVTRWREETVAAYAMKMSRGMAEEVVSLVPAPRRYPPFQDLLFDSLGYLWIGLGPADDGRSEDEYLVFDGDLRLSGRVRLPPMKVVGIGAAHLLGVRRDSLGVEEVAVFPLLR